MRFEDAADLVGGLHMALSAQAFGGFDQFGARNRGGRL
jgi:hypothetical protein